MVKNKNIYGVGDYLLLDVNIFANYPEKHRKFSWAGISQQSHKVKNEELFFGTEKMS
jgi:hypothetical protein